MLTYIDVFLGVAMVMLAVSLLLTIVTQAVSLLLNLRGGQLLKGLAELFQTLKIDGDGGPLARKILTHPLIAVGSGKRLAPAISRGDLIHLLDRAGTPLLDVTPDVATKIREAKQDVELWFDAAMGRVAHRFTAWTRIITVIGAVVAAFLLQLDAFGLVARLYADSDLRSRMAGAASALVTEGQEVLATPTVFTEVAKTLAAGSEGKLAAPPASLQSREQAESWIHGTVPDKAVADALVTRYGELLEQALAPAFKRWLGKAADINDKLAGAGLRLVPKPYRPFDYGTVWSFLGVIASAALLSLGAPFWFNTLKTVSNLRPAVAASVQARDETAADKRAGADGS
jgi:hypothetical protein